VKTRCAFRKKSITPGKRLIDAVDEERLAASPTVHRIDAAAGRLGLRRIIYIQIRLVMRRIPSLCLAGFKALFSFVLVKLFGVFSHGLDGQ
jgi:hypothetical protein